MWWVNIEGVLGVLAAADGKLLDFMEGEIFSPFAYTWTLKISRPYLVLCLGAVPVHYEDNDQ